MKPVWLTLLFCLAFCCIEAQPLETCGFSVLSDTGEKITIWVNGVKHNRKPGSHVFVSDLATDIVNVKIDWANPELKDFEKKLYLRLGEVEHYRIKVNKRNEYYLGFDRSEPIPIGNPHLFSPGFESSLPYSYPPERYHDDFFRSCTRPVSDRSAFTMLQVIQNENFESEKLKRAKEAVTRSCLDSRQIGLLLSGFSFESTRLEFSKFAYPFAYDKGAYIIVSEYFEYSSSRENLERYIMAFTRRR